MAKGIAHRKWTLYRADYRTDADFRAAVEQEQALNVHIMERLGVAIVSGPGRTREGSDFSSEVYVFQTATIPAVTGEDREQPGEVESLEQALAATPDTGEDEA